MRLTYATRRSALALAQSRAFVRDLRAIHPSVEFLELEIVTSGDRIQDRPLAEIGGKGLFVKEIEEALLAKRADFAVHSIKDVPAELPSGLRISCVPKREDPRDALVAPKFGTLAQLPHGARVGTSSLRRAVSLKRLRPDLDIVPLRGNVDTRLRKVDAGEMGAIVLAYAGLVRLGLGSRATELLSQDASLPAVGQGALGIETRMDDERIGGILDPAHDVASGICVAAERGVLESLGGDCRTPIAAHAERVGERIRVCAFLADPDGSHFRFAAREAVWPSEQSFGFGTPKDTLETAARGLGMALGDELKALRKLP